MEKTYPSGHGTSGRLDICVTRDNGPEYLLIECKNYGKDFEKEFNRTRKDGGQIFTYFKFKNEADVIMLYASERNGKEIIYRNEIVKIEDDYRNIGGAESFYEKWNKLTKNNGVFEEWVKPYNFESKALTSQSLEEIKLEDSSFIFNRFLEILRHNVVSDKPNAFNKIFTLFLCKIYDEKINDETNNELAFQWFNTPYQYNGLNYSRDDHISFQKRLTDLYKRGMKEFLEKDVTDISDADFERKYGNISEDIRRKILDDLTEIRLKKNNEFAIKEVFDDESFGENAKVVKEVVELLQRYKIRYATKQQYLSDFFELLLTTGLKQESGQFFTPVPVAQFIIKSLPMDKIVQEKLKKGIEDEYLPYIIDYAAGSGHFVTESMHELQRLLKSYNCNKFFGGAKKFVDKAQNHPYDWALKYVYSIEKDYRLVKVGKVGCYLHGDGLARIIHSDGLGDFTKTNAFKEILTKTDKDFPMENKQFDIVVSNPPYSVSAFKNNAAKFYGKKDFELYDSLTDNSSEIECLFVERTKQLLKDDGIAGVILPSSILSNEGIYAKAREIILQYFNIIAITELGSNTFMATGTNTVVLFLRRRNNYDTINLQKSVERFFEDWQDVTRNGIEKPIAQYVNQVWESINFKDYVSFLKKEPSNAVVDHEIYKEYRKKIKAKTENAFWNTVVETEKQKLLYFILAYLQKVVLIKTGKKNAEKRFLGYEFSNRRGSEGIHPIQRGKSIEECTKLFDDEQFENPEKASTYIYKAFNNEYPKVHETLKNNVFCVSLVDTLVFNRATFDKSISIAVKKKVTYDDVWKTRKLISIKDVAVIQKGTAITKEKTVNGSIPVIAGGKEPAYFHNIANRNGNIITISASGAYSGFVNYFEIPIFASDCNTIQSNDENNISTKLIYLFLKSIQEEIYRLQKGQAQPHVYAEDLAKIKLPFPPKEIQQKIVFEIEVLEKKEVKAKEKIAVGKEKIEQLFTEAVNKATDIFRLSNSDVFDISIGKRVIEANLNGKGTIPVYSANVFEPFGYIDKYLITDFSVSSILWGIDGDWQVNYMPADKPFYPTDHCGVLRIKSDKILPKYLAWVLKKEGIEQQFSRALRASIDRIKGLSVKVPPLSEQRELVANIEKIEAQIAEAQKIIDETAVLKNEVLKKYL
ncbi:MAG: restriction endonuclease subunit S [Chitinivibrionia bacterium]|nr:restriction endonuclease subunit S [Chitinivibrionia bacterium]